MDDIEKLRLLLPHWKEHNVEHAAEFRAWAERARRAGNDHVAAHIEAAAQKMEDAQVELEEAIAQLGGPGEPPSHEHTHPHHPHTH